MEDLQQAQAMLVAMVTIKSCFGLKVSMQQQMAC